MLHSADIDIIEKFKIALKFNGQIYKTLDNRNGVVINSRELSEQLEKLVWLLIKHLNLIGQI